MKTKFTSLLLLLFLGLASFEPSTPESEEYNIKAAFIYKFTNYIEWDEHLTGDEFVIGIMGQSPISGPLTSLAKTKTIKGKRIVVKQYYSPDEIGRCHILFISQKAGNPLPEILEKTPDKGTLTIGEKPGYAAQGTEFNFVLSDNKLKFEANLKAIDAAGLTASSQLLKLAVIVN